MRQCRYNRGMLLLSSTGERASAKVRRRKVWILGALLFGCAVQAPIASVELSIPVLAPVDSWVIQLQGIEPAATTRALCRRNVDMVVLEPMRSQQNEETFPMRELVTKVQQSAGGTLPNKRVIAYLNVGQAEDYRSYWRRDWRAPTAAGAGSPPFLLGLDPDGWQGNYPVAYWDPAWQRCLFGAPDAPLDQILADGFDGIYCDWVLGFGDPAVQAAAKAAGVDPAVEMVRLLQAIRTYARARYPLFVLIAQNGLALAEQRPELLAAVDALAQEDLSFRGTATAGWADPAAGDIPATAEGPWSTAGLGERLSAMRQRKVPVFALDYALRPENVQAAIATARRFGCVPCVSRTPLDRLPD